MKSFQYLTVFLATVFAAVHLQAQITVNPLSSFGGGDGWLAPGEGGYGYLTTGNTERGLAYNPVTGNLLLVSRANPTGTNGVNIRILDSLTGADLSPVGTGGLNLGSGVVSGGTFPVNMVSVGSDGAIYVANLTIQASTTPFKIYRWADEGSTPTTAYNGTPIQGGRVGDTLDAIGGGAGTLLVAGFGNSPATNGNNGYAIFDPTAGTHTQVTFAGTPPNAGDFRLGITFTDSSHVIGSQGAGVDGFARYTSFSGSDGTLIGTAALTSGSQRLFDFTVVGGVSLLAVMDTVDSQIRLYEASDPLNLAYLTTATTLSSASVANANGTGAVAWGDAVYDSDSGQWLANLYALNSNNGIQAFLVTVPEPSTFGFLALGGLLLAAWRARGRR